MSCENIGNLPNEFCLKTNCSLCVAGFMTFADNYWHTIEDPEKERRKKVSFLSKHYKLDSSPPAHH